jgi:hypothetical protein
MPIVTMFSARERITFLTGIAGARNLATRRRCEGDDHRGEQRDKTAPAGERFPDLYHLSLKSGLTDTGRRLASRGPILYFRPPRVLGFRSRVLLP